MTTVAKVSQPGRLKASTADDEPERRELAEADMTPPVGGAVKGFVVRASSGIPFPLAQLLPVRWSPRSPRSLWFRQAVHAVQIASWAGHTSARRSWRGDDRDAATRGKGRLEALTPLNGRLIASVPGPRAEGL